MVIPSGLQSGASSKIRNRLIIVPIVWTRISSLARGSAQTTGPRHQVIRLAPAALKGVLLILPLRRPTLMRPVSDESKLSLLTSQRARGQQALRSAGRQAAGNPFRTASTCDLARSEAPSSLYHTPVHP